MRKKIAVALLAGMMAFGAARAEAAIAKGAALRPGDCIGVVAPGCAEDREVVEAALRHFRRMGYRLKLGASCGERFGYFAGTDFIRASDINRFFRDEEVKAILCLRGGYGSARVLDKLDYAEIAKHPKQFIGYSDITALHIALAEKSGLATIHGPMLRSFAKGFDTKGYTAKNFQRGLRGELFPGEIPLPDGKRLESVNPGRAEGVIIGGNLTMIASLAGTPYELQGEGTLLFIEDLDEDTYRVDRELQQLWQSGLLSRVNGILVGDFIGADDEWEEGDFRLDDVLRYYARLSGKPMIRGVPAGHGKNNLYLPFGIHAVMSAGEDGAASLVIDETPLTQ